MHSIFLAFWGLSELLAGTPQAQAARPTVALSGTYQYLSYTILDKGTSPRPLPAQGVGGTLTLHPDGTYQKRLSLSGNGGQLHFDQEGRFQRTADRLTFTYADQQHRSRTDQATFQLRDGLLTLVVAGFPAGNQSTYTLRRQP